MPEVFGPAMHQYIRTWRSTQRINDNKETNKKVQSTNKNSWRAKKHQDRPIRILETSGPPGHQQITTWRSTKRLNKPQWNNDNRETNKKVQSTNKNSWRAEIKLHQDQRGI